MAIYLGILTTSTIFSFCYSKARDKSAQIVFLVSCFMSLFIPAAVRYGIGNDYDHYVQIFNRIATGRNVSQEIGFVLICKILQFFHLPYHFLFVTFSLLTIFFVFASIPRKYFYIAIPCYVMFIHFQSYNLIRQELASAIIFFACKFFFEKKYKLYVFWCIIAVFNHKAALIPAILIPCSQLIPLLTAKKTLMLYVIAFVFLDVIKVALVEFTMTNIVGRTPYASYAINAYSSLETEMNSGIGNFARLVMQATFLILILESSVSNMKKKYSVLFIFLIMAIRELGIVLAIIMRLAGIILIAVVNLTVFSSQSKNRLRKICLLAIYLLMLVMFVKDMRSFTISTYRLTGRQIYPYVSIFNWQDNPIIFRRMQRF